jgi:hypothetical protein
VSDDKIPNEDLPVLEGWLGVQAAADRLGYTRQHVFRLFKARKFGSLRRIEDSYTVVVSQAEIEHLVAERSGEPGAAEQE